MGRFRKGGRRNDGSVFDIPQEILDADGRTNYQDLTLDEFRTLRDTIKAIEAQGRLARTIEVEGQRVYLDDAETEITDRLQDRPMTKRGIGKQRGYPDSLKGKWNEWKDKRMANLASFDASLVKIEFLAFQVDGEKGGRSTNFSSRRLLMQRQRETTWWQRSASRLWTPSKTCRPKCRGR